MTPTPPQSQTPETDAIKRYYSNDFMQMVCMASEVNKVEAKLSEAVAEIKLQTERAEHAIDQYLKDQLPEGCETWEKVWDNQVKLTKENQSLLAQIAVKDEALKVSICNFILHKNGMKMGDLEAIIKNQDNALTNSPAAAQELLERMQELIITNQMIGKERDELIEVRDRWSKDISKLRTSLSEIKRYALRFDDEVVPPMCAEALQSTTQQPINQNRGGEINNPRNDCE